MPEPLRAEALACIDPGCLGAKIAAAGGIAAVVATLEVVRARRASAPAAEIQVTVAWIEPVSGTPRTEPFRATVTAEAPAATVLAPALEALRAFVPPPPARTTLLIAVNADGVDVALDGQRLGTSPLAPIELAPGRHTLQATHPSMRAASTASTSPPARPLALISSLRRTHGRRTCEQARDERRAASGAARSSPWYVRWYVLGAVGLLVAGGATVGIVLATQEQAGFVGVPVPPIQ